MKLYKDEEIMSNIQHTSLDVSIFAFVQHIFNHESSLSPMAVLLPIHYFVKLCTVFIL